MKKTKSTNETSTTEATTKVAQAVSEAAKAVWKSVSPNELPESFKSDPEKTIAVGLTLGELYQCIVGLQGVHDALMKSDFKAYQHKAAYYSALAKKLDKIYNDNNYPRAYTVQLTYAK